MAIKEILFRAAERTATEVAFIANQRVNVPPSKYISAIQVNKGFDVADNEIVKRSAAGDLVITSDIPLADEIISKGCLALNPRGELLTRDNIKARLNIRDFMDTMRRSGVQTSGPPPLGPREKQAFANQLDQWLTQKTKSRPSHSPES